MNAETAVFMDRKEGVLLFENDSRPDSWQFEVHLKNDDKKDNEIKCYDLLNTAGGICLVTAAELSFQLLLFFLFLFFLGFLFCLFVHV